MTVGQVPVGQLSVVERAFPQTFDNAKLKADIEAHGIKTPLLVDENVVVDGARRLAVALELGLATVPVLQDPTFDEVVKLVRKVDEDSHFGVPYIYRWLDLVPVLDYMSKLGRARWAQIRRDRLEHEISAKFGDEMYRALGAPIGISADLRRLERLLKEPPRGQAGLVHAIIVDMNKGLIGPMGASYRFNHYAFTGNVTNANEQRRLINNAIVGGQVATKAFNEIGQLNASITEEEKNNWVKEVKALQRDFARIATRLSQRPRAADKKKTFKGNREAVRRGQHGSN